MTIYASWGKSHVTLYSSGEKVIQTLHLKTEGHPTLFIFERKVIEILYELLQRFRKHYISLNIREGFLKYEKLDGVGPVDNKPSTDRGSFP